MVESRKGVIVRSNNTRLIAYINNFTIEHIHLTQNQARALFIDINKPYIDATDTLHAFLVPDTVVPMFAEFNDSDLVKHFGTRVIVEAVIEQNEYNYCTMKMHDSPKTDMHPAVWSNQPELRLVAEKAPSYSVKLIKNKDPV